MVQGGRRARWCPSSAAPRVAKLAEKFGASAVVVEGFEAGGHLGTDRPMRDLLPEILDAVDIPVIGAGGVVTGADISEVLDMGAAGVQMGTRFAATVESSAPEALQADVRRRHAGRRRARQEPGSR